MPRQSKLVVLPWKAPVLNLNRKSHWAVKTRDTRTVREVTAVLCRDIDKANKIRVRLVYVPKDNRRRDADNLVAMLKPICDGIVDAGIVPDDTPQFMEKLMPEVARADPKQPRFELYVESIA